MNDQKLHQEIDEAISDKETIALREKTERIVTDPAEIDYMNGLSKFYLLVFGVCCAIAGIILYFTR